METNISQNTTLSELCVIIRNDWKNMNDYAKPYFDAMCALNSVEDNYGLDSGKSIVTYFLCNASTWRGPVAREVKKLLNKMIK